MPTQRLELTWIGKNNPEYDIANIEPRILIEDTEKSHGESTSENLLIHGDNLLALKALLPDYEGKIKCIYIDPPYNTGNAFEHYDDSVEHSTWLSLMKPRLELLSELLSEEGSIWITLDDNELHYCKVMCDEIFGRRNFISSIVWQKVFAKKNKALISGSHDSILVYAKDTSKWQRNLLMRNDKQLKAFKNPDNDPRGIWQSVAFSVQSEDSEKRAAYRYEITTPTGNKVMPPAWRHWNWLPDRALMLQADNRLWFGPDGNNPPRIKVFLNEVQDWIVPDTWWNHEDCWNNQDAKKEMLEIFKWLEPFSTPKPEKLLKRVIEISSNEGDFILDSFLGSGTTAAVAHKMWRRWIGIEMGDHAYTHCKVRLDKVVDGEDQWGISKTVEWQWGGWYKFYELAPSFITIDEFGNRIIDEYYNDSKLVRAMCKLMNYTFKPSQTEYFKQGVGTGHNYLFVTTQTLSIGLVRQIVSHLGTNETLVICPKKYEAGAESVDPRITIKKIPQSILKACHYGKKDYLLPIRESTLEEIEEEDEE